MSFRGRGPAVPPKNYVPGLGRGAAGFTTRSDVGPMLPSAAAGGDEAAASMMGSGSRASEARAAKWRQQQQTTSLGTTPAPVGGLFGAAPANYVAGAGRGAGSLSHEEAGGPTGMYDPFVGYVERGPRDGPASMYDPDDDEADRIWAEIDQRMNQKRQKKRKLRPGGEAAAAAAGNEEEDQEERQTIRARIRSDFHELKEKLSDVTEDQWASIPDVGDYSLKHKASHRQQQRPDVFTPLTDSLLEQRTRLNQDATAGNKTLAATTAAAAAASLSDGLASTVTPAADGSGGFVTNLSGLSAARGTVLGMSLDRMMSDSAAAGSQTSVDPQGYLTSLSSTKIASSAEISDINKARLLLKSVRDTNPKHGPGWIASARVEEAAGKIWQARQIIQQGCDVCPDHEDVWLEAARLHPPEVAKSILATAVRRIPTSVKIFLKAAELEQGEEAKKAVLRKGLEANPTSVKLWKAAIDLEEAEDARILLSVAVEKIPHSVEMWLALARLESYENAQRVLNKAKKALPAERSIWIAAAKLEESQNHHQIVGKIIERAVRTLEKNEAVITRAQWLQEAEAAEAAGAPVTSAAIVRQTIGKDVDQEDRQRTWADDAKSTLARGSIATARAILAHALTAFPGKKNLWMQAVELERKHGTATTLDEVLAAASERLPRVEIFWLLRAKERWLAKDVDKAREILTNAFSANPDSEEVWLAAAKLEWENKEIERARVLLQRARERAPTARVYMKSALLEREEKGFSQALELIEQGISSYPTFAKLYMMGGQICSDDLPKEKSHLDRARRFYQRGLEKCPNNAVLWILASRLEERAHTFQANAASSNAGAGSTKARGLLELARLKNPKNPELWLEAIRLERRTGNSKLAETLMAKALQECPQSGILLAENIRSAPRVEQKSKSADAIKRCPEDPQVIAAVAGLFASERKNDKARKWYDRAVVLKPDLGDSWARYYAFELECGTREQQDKVKERCIAAEPKYGELWTSIMKDMAHRGKSVGEGLEMTAQLVLQQKNGQLRA